MTAAAAVKVVDSVTSPVPAATMAQKGMEYLNQQSESTQSNSTGIEKATFFVAISIGLFIPYFCLCFTMHKLSLKTKDNEKKFYALSPKERGKVIRDGLSGWW